MSFPRLRGRFTTAALAALLVAGAACGKSGESDDDRAATNPTATTPPATAQPGPGLSGIPTSATTQACRTDFKSVELSAEAAYAKTGTYPTASGDLVSSAGKGGLLKAYPASPDYTLAYAGNGDRYTITVSGPGLTSGTTEAACAGG